MTVMYKGSFNHVLAKFLSGEAVATNEEANEIERVIRLMSWEVSTLGNSVSVLSRRSWWPWRRGRGAR
ncbi:MAG: hypothetical protein ACKVQU_38415 [Burkholderiales bacterium]